MSGMSRFPPLLFIRTSGTVRQCILQFSLGGFQTIFVSDVSIFFLNTPPAAEAGVGRGLAPFLLPECSDPEPGQEKGTWSDAGVRK